MNPNPRARLSHQRALAVPPLCYIPRFVGLTRPGQGSLAGRLKPLHWGSERWLIQEPTCTASAPNPLSFLQVV